jgi:hypothetical protein
MSLAAFYRGDTKTYPFTFKVKDSDPVVPIDLTGKTLKFTMKAAKSDPDPGALQKTLGPFSGPDAVAGTGTLVLTSTDTDALTPGKYFFDFQLTDPGTSPPTVQTVGAGSVTVLEDVTRVP